MHLSSGFPGWRLSLDGAGPAGVWLWVAGATAITIGGQLLAQGRRRRGPGRVFLLLVVILVAAGVVAPLQSGGRMPRLPL